MNFSNWGFWDWTGNTIYLLLGIDAIWGAYCAAMVWLRVGQMGFKSEAQQDVFMQHLKENLENQDLPAAVELCNNDRRALPQLILLGLNNLDLGFNKIAEHIAERFQRDVMADFEHYVNWINNVIKTAPMLGLLRTVLGMMGAFAKLSGGDNVKPQALAGDIQTALITTALGLAIAIPATIFVNSINGKIRKIDDLVGSGLGKFFEYLGKAMGIEEEE